MSAPPSRTGHAPPPGRRSRRALAIAAGVVVVLVIAAATLGWWVVATPPGARWAFERLGGFLPGELDADSLVGPIRGPLLAKNVRFRSDKVEITIRRLALDWSLRDLVHQRLDIHRFEADTALVKFFAGDSVAAAPDTTPLADIDLPLDVMVRSGRIRALEITLAGADTAIVFDEIGFKDVALRDTLAIGALRVDSPAFDAEVSGRADPHGAYAVDLGVRWRYRAARGRDLAGEGRIAGSLDTLRILQDVRTPFAATLDLVAYHPLRDLRFRGTVDFDALDLRAIDPAWPEARASGRVEVAGRPEAFTSRGDVRGTLAPLDRIAADWQVERDGPRWNVRRLTVTRPGRPDRVVATGGVLATPDGPRFTLDGDWRAVEWPLGPRSRLVTPRGAFQIEGVPQRYRLAVRGDVGLDSIAPSPWRLEGTGSTEALALHGIDGRALGGTVRGHGRVGWSATPSWDFDLRAAGIDPSALWAPATGAVAFDLDTRGRAGARGARGDLAIANLTGALRGHPVSGRAAAAFGPGALDVRDLDVHWGPNQVVARGAVAPRWSLAGRLDAPDLSVAGPEFAGALVAEAGVMGSAAAPRVTGTATGDSLRFGTWSVGRLVAEAEVAPRGGPGSRFTIEGSGIGSAGRQIEHALLTGEGRLEAHAIRATATAGDDSLAVALDGGWRRGAWDGELATLDVRSAEAGAWSLDAPARLVAGARAATLEGFAWRSGDSRVLAGGTWRRDAPWRATGRLENLQLALLEPLLPEDLALDGPVDGPFAVGATASGRWLAEADLTIGPGAMSYDRPGGRGTLRLDPGTMRVRSDDAGIAAAVDLSSPDAGTVRGEARFLPGRGPRPRLEGLEGEARVLLTNLDFVQGFVPDVSGTAGRFEANLSVDGTFARPRWRGDARLTGGQADLTRLGIALRDVGLAAQSDAEGRLTFRAGAQSGPGRLDVQGDARFTAGGTPRVDAAVTGSRFQAMGTEDVTAYVSPDLRVQVIGDSLRVTGEIVVPEAELRAQARDEELVAASRDVVIVGGAPQQWERRADLYAEVRLVLGDQVRIDAYGLAGRPTGSVLVIDRPGWPSSGTGELRITEGTYTAYGQDLAIERGRLVFGGGPVRNPGLDIRASRRATDGVVAGFEVRGTLEQPRLSLFSQPAMAERDALAYIVLGRPIDRGSSSDQSIVDEAAGALGVQGGSWLAGRLGSEIGLDEATVQTKGGFDQATLMLGTYLSPRVYVNYGIGILDPVSTLRVQYFLHRRWTLQAETGVETRGQILYTVER